MPRSFLKSACIAIALACTIVGGQAQAQQAVTHEQVTWQGLPFNSVADYERLIPIGLSSADVVRALGAPEATMPGRESDIVYHYGYQLTEGGELRAVIILRDDVVFIRRLYISSPNGATSRQN